MSFPDLLIKIKKHKRCRTRFRIRKRHQQVCELIDDQFELLQYKLMDTIVSDLI